MKKKIVCLILTVCLLCVGSMSVFANYASYDKRDTCYYVSMEGYMRYDNAFDVNTVISIFNSSMAPCVDGNVNVYYTSGNDTWLVGSYYLRANMNNLNVNDDRCFGKPFGAPDGGTWYAQGDFADDGYFSDTFSLNVDGSD